MERWGWTSIVAILLLSLLGGCASRPPDDAARLHALFERHWDARVRTEPEWATYRGEHRSGDRWLDNSPAGVAERDAIARDALAEAQAIDPRGLSDTDRVSREVFIAYRAMEVEMQAHEGWRGRTLRSLWGYQTRLVDLMRVVPVDTPAQVEQLLARFAAYPASVDQEIARLRRGLAAGWGSPRPVLERVLAQIDGQLADPAPLREPFGRLGHGMPAEQRAGFEVRGREAVERRVLPALARLRAFVHDEALPQAPAALGLHGLPGGREAYAALVRERTTTELEPEAIHAIGLRELARLRAEMEAVQREVGHPGSFADFVRHLNTDPRYFAAGPNALLAHYREIAKRIDPELPRLFAELPRAPYGVRAMPEHLGPDAADSYNGPALDGSRGGWFNANTAGWRTRPLWAAESLVAHETVPGHHLQVAREAELTALPRFRRAGGGIAYNEGWALYAETLGFELGLYRDPLSRFGHLRWQAFRAARLVVDTGLHAKGWGREQAIEFMVERTGFERGFVASEVDRYLSQPAQALGYMIGQLKFVELRERARAALGTRFDIRRFHMTVLDVGNVPLGVLERAVDDWIAAERSR